MQQSQQSLLIILILINYNFIKCFSSNSCNIVGKSTLQLDHIQEEMNKIKALVAESGVKISEGFLFYNKIPRTVLVNINKY
jgi:hypothetical protein